MPRVSDLAIAECIAEVRAACRRPIEQSALDDLFTQLRPNFESVLDNAEGPSRWLDHGWRMRDNGRFLGALADFASHRADVPIVGRRELFEAFGMVRDACRVGVELSSDAPNPVKERS